MLSGEMKCRFSFLLLKKKKKERLVDSELILLLNKLLNIIIVLGLPTKIAQGCSVSPHLLPPCC